MADYPWHEVHVEEDGIYALFPEPPGEQTREVTDHLVGRIRVKCDRGIFILFYFMSINSSVLARSENELLVGARDAVLNGLQVVALSEQRTTYREAFPALQTVALLGSNQQPTRFFSHSVVFSCYAAYTLFAIDASIGDAHRFFSSFEVLRSDYIDKWTSQR